jgi:hypothetical protein
MVAVVATSSYTTMPMGARSLPHAHCPPFRCLPLQVPFRQQHGFLRVYAIVKDALLHDKPINIPVYDSLSTSRITRPSASYRPQ